MDEFRLFAMPFFNSANTLNEKTLLKMHFRLLQKSLLLDLLCDFVPGYLTFNGKTTHKHNIFLPG